MLPSELFLDYFDFRLYSNQTDCTIKSMNTAQIKSKYEAAKTLGEVRELISSILENVEGVYFRSGDIPTNGLSYNYAEGSYECGVSVWETPWSQSLAGMTRSKWIAVRGKVCGCGSDGEPVVTVEESILFFNGESNIANSEEAFIRAFCKRGSKLRKWIENAR